SATRPMRPPKASMSRTSCPLATPPMAGLHDMRPMALRSMVTMAVEHPSRAAAWAASMPACPPPMTTTSKLREGGGRGVDTGREEWVGGPRRVMGGGGAGTGRARLEARGAPAQEAVWKGFFAKSRERMAPLNGLRTGERLILENPRPPCDMAPP